MLGLLFLFLRIALTISLFAFLGWALWLLWNDLKKASRLSMSSLIPELKLISLDGKPPFQFAQAEVLIGRDPACQCCISDKTISGKHARLYYNLSQWWIEDLGSTNGTFINQQPIITPTVLTSGDVLRLGGVTFEIFISKTPESAMEIEFL